MSHKYYQPSLLYFQENTLSSSNVLAIRRQQLVSIFNQMYHKLTRLETSPRNILFSCTSGSSRNWGLKPGISCVAVSYVLCNVPYSCRLLNFTHQKQWPGNCICPEALHPQQDRQSNTAAVPFILQQSRGWNEEPLKAGPNTSQSFSPKCCEGAPDNSWCVCTWNQTRTGMNVSLKNADNVFKFCMWLWNTQ